MNNLPLIIMASARKEGETTAFLNRAFAGVAHKQLNLLDVSISPYDYNNKYAETDDFLKIVAELLQHPVIVFATPVYWYAMSGLLKTFFDRFTDLVTVKKHLGRQLKGKTTFLLAVGADPALPVGFEIPFQLTAEYLYMSYEGSIYHSTKFPKREEILQEEIKTYIGKICNTR